MIFLKRARRLLAVALIVSFVMSGANLIYAMDLPEACTFEDLPYEVQEKIQVDEEWDYFKITDYLVLPNGALVVIGYMSSISEMGKFYQELGKSSNEIYDEIYDEYGIYLEIKSDSFPFFYFFEFNDDAYISGFNDDKINLCTIEEMERKHLNYLNNAVMSYGESIEYTSDENGGIISIHVAYIYEDGSSKRDTYMYYAANGRAICNTKTDANTGAATNEQKPPIYIYGESDLGESIILPIDKIKETTNLTQAEALLIETMQGISDEQKKSAAGVDKVTVMAEELLAQSSSMELKGDTININDTTLKGQNVTETAKTLEDTLAKQGMKIQRKMSNTVKIKSANHDKVTVNKEDISSSSDVDAIKVETPFIGLTMDKGMNNDITVENKGSNKVEVQFANASLDSKVKVSFPSLSEGGKYLAVVDEKGNAIGGKYNPATGELEAKIQASGIYTVVNNEKNFTDIKGKSQEMQEAIKLLASKGIISGTSASAFSPDKTISRAEIAMLLVKALSAYEPNENGGYKDVTKQNWYFGAAGSSKKNGIISGFTDNSFRGDDVILKDQIAAVSGRILKNEMHYFTPTAPNTYLSIYEDYQTIADWAKGDVALATQGNLILRRTDSRFAGAEKMTRGDAAIIIKRLFDKIW